MQGSKTFQPQIVITNFPIWHCSISIRWHQPDFNIHSHAQNIPKSHQVLTYPRQLCHPSSTDYMSFLQAGTEICYLIYHIDSSYLEVPHHFKLKCIRFQSTEVDFQASIKNTVQAIEFFKRHLSSEKYHVKGSYLYLADPGFWIFYSKATHYSVKQKTCYPMKLNG